MHGAARSALFVLALGACRDDAGAVARDAPAVLSSAAADSASTKGADPREAAATPPADPAHAKLADPPENAATPSPARRAAADGPALRPAYSGCLGDFAVAEVAGEAYVLYGYGATGRVDRLAADGSVAEAYDLPIGASVLRYAGPKGPAEDAKVPVAALRGIGGVGPRQLLVVAELNVANETWDDRLFALRGRSWKETASFVGELYPRGDGGVLGYASSEEERDVSHFDAIEGSIRAPDLEVILERAHAAGAGPDTLDGIFGPPGIDVYDYAVSRRGPILALVRYHDRLGGSQATPVGSWLMVWDRDAELAAIERVSQSFELARGQVVAGEDSGYLLVDSTLRRWRAGALEALPMPDFAAGDREGCPRLVGVDAEGRLLATCDRELARLEGGAWLRENLPGVDAPATITGVEHGALWVRYKDGSLWSRAADGTWTRHPVPVDAPAHADVIDPHETLVITSDGAAWLVREFVHPDEMTAAGQLLSTSFVYTSRPLEGPNACRGVDPKRPAERSRPLTL